jgi:peptide/nickel transport system ATP-binding protein
VSVLEVKGLVVDFARRNASVVRAVDDVSFGLEEGETLALVGESGSGKSTIIMALARLLRPSAGDVFLDGSATPKRGRGVRSYRRKVQLVFQDPFASLNPAHTVGHHLRRPLVVNGHPRSRLEEAVESLLEQVGLVPAAEMKARFPHELSGGQRQRVAIARALATSPAVLLADEPVSMLDVSIRLDILHLLDDLRRDRRLALLYVTHDLATARHFSARIMVMYRGQIVERGPTDEVILSPAHPYTQLLASAAPDPGRPPGRQEHGARPARSTSAEEREVAVSGGCRFRSRCPFAMAVCEQDPPEVAVRPGQGVRCWLYADGNPKAVL